MTVKTAHKASFMWDTLTRNMIFPRIKQKAKILWVNNDRRKGIVAPHICGVSSKMYHSWGSKPFNMFEDQESRRKISAFWQTIPSISLNGMVYGKLKDKSSCFRDASLFELLPELTKIFLHSSSPETHRSYNLISKVKCCMFPESHIIFSSSL